MLDGRQSPRKILKLLYALYQSAQNVTESSKGVYIGSGIGSLDDVYDTSIAYNDGVRRTPSPCSSYI